MIRTLVVSLGLLFSAGQAFAQGIEFFHGTWPEALERAKKEEKLIFVDAFASWCGPCKRMAAQTFTDAKAGDFFNSNFICLKIDMEKPENEAFATKYPVSSYPTIMFIDAEGKQVLRNIGFQEVDPLIDMAKKALTKQVNLDDMQRQYTEGKREPQFLYNYVRALNRGGQPSLKITNEYLNSQQDLTTEFNQRFILEGAIEADSRVFDLLVKYQSQIKALAGEDAFKSRAEMACRNTLQKAIQFKNQELLNETKGKMKQSCPDKAANFAFEADMKYYAATQDVKNFLKAAKAFQKAEVKDNAARLNSLVVSLMRAFPEDPAALKQAEKWAKTAAKNGGLPEYFMSLAEVYKRMGDKDKARETAQKAIEAIGEKDNGMKAQIEHFINTLG